LNNYFFSLSVISILLILSLIDIKKRIVPGAWIFLLLFIAVIAGILSDSGIAERACGMAAAFVPLTAVALITGGIGGGDIKLFTALGCFCGVKTIIELEILSFILSGIFIVLSVTVRIIVTGKHDSIMDSELPFVPFITLSFAVLLLDFFVK